MHRFKSINSVGAWRRQRAWCCHILLRIFMTIKRQVAGSFLVSIFLFLFFFIFCASKKSFQQIEDDIIMMFFVSTQLTVRIAYWMNVGNATVAIQHNTLIKVQSVFNVEIKMNRNEQKLGTTKPVKKALVCQSELIIIFPTWNVFESASPITERAYWSHPLQMASM